MAYTLTQQLTSGMAGKGIVNTYDIDDRIQGKTQEAINQDLYQKLVDTGNIAAGISTVDYDSNTKRINFRSSDSTIICYLDATLFIKDGIVDSVQVDDVEIDNTLTKCLVISFNTDADKQDIIIPIKDIIDQDLFYTKTEIDSYNEGINSSITDLQNSRLFREENGGLKTNINNKAPGVNSFSEGLTTNALGANSHSEGKGLNISSNPEEAYTAGGNFVIIDNTNDENIAIGSKLYYPKKVETATVLALSSDSDNDINFIQVLLSTGFVENINAGEYIYINNNNEFTPVEVVFNYTAGNTTIKVSEEADNIEIGTILSSNSIDTPFGIKTITNIETIENNTKLYLNSPIEYDLATTDTIYIESGVASGQGSHSEGLGTNAIGDYSHTSGVFTNTTNEGEFACGTRNKSTEDITMFSVGIGETNHVNALEVNTDGDLYIKGTGGYDGTNITGTGVKSVQEVLSDVGNNAALEARVSAIEARFVKEIIDKITGGISFTLGNLYAGYPKTVTATGTVSLPTEVTADKITSIKLVGNGQTVEQSGQTSVSIQNNVTAPQTYTLTASIAAPYTKSISKTATVNKVCPIYIALVDSDIDTAAKVITEIAKVDNLYSPNSPVSSIKSITNKAFTYTANQRLAFICGQSGIRVKQVGGLADDPYTVNGESTTINGMTAYVYLTGTQQAGTRNITFNP